MSGASSRSDGSVPPLQCPGGPSGAFSAHLSQSADVLCSAQGWRGVLCCTHLTSKLKAATDTNCRWPHSQLTLTHVDTNNQRKLKQLPEMAKVFKKTSGNGGLTLYLGKRDYVDHVSAVDRVDGVVKVDTADFGDRKAFVQLACAFRYGSEDLDVMGLCFRKDIWFEQTQIYPENSKPQLSAMHETLLKKAGDNAYPFSFE
ncbi:hypothetical protein AMECASPLE_013163, partial [Ameca splendens]